MDKAFLEVRCPQTLGNLSEPARDIRDGRHLLKALHFLKGHSLNTFV